MGRHVVFTLHGMGQHSNGWSTEGVESFLAVADDIGFPNESRDNLEFFEINYNHLFEQYLSEHKKHSESLSDFVEKSASIGRSSFYKGLYDYASEVPDKDEFVVNALGDVFLYRATEYEQIITSFVLQQISSKLNATDDLRAWSLVGHSLGTRVLHDSIEIALTDPDFFNVFGKPTCIAMIANVCHLLAYRPSDLWKNSSVYPSESLNKGGCFRYVNAMHPLDPFMWIRPFEPKPIWGSGATAQSGFLNVEIVEGDLKRLNPHSFAGYLENPRVAAAMCTGFGTRSKRIPAFDKRLLKEAIANYESQTLGGQIASIKLNAEQMREQGSSTSFKSFVNTLREFESFLNTLGVSLSGGDTP